VLLSPPNAQLLLVTHGPSGLSVAAATPLVPPTPSLRQAEFFSSVLCQGNLAVVSLWVGVLSCIEIEVDKDKRRRSSVAGGSDKKLRFRDNFNIKWVPRQFLANLQCPRAQSPPPGFHAKSTGQ
jgi:DNA damage-binding protein 1